MQIVYRETYLSDMEFWLDYYQKFDQQENTILEDTFFKRINEISDSLKSFPKLGRVENDLRVISLSKKSQDTFKKIELHYAIEEQTLYFIKLVHRSQNL